MSVKDTYRTFSSRSEGTYKEKGSKFIALGSCVHSELEIKTFLELIKREFHDARHHCYAWRLGAEGEPHRTNDDGEPNNSAGKPILGQLVKHDLSNVIIIVVRYFGGVKLGVGGLITAYKRSAEECILNGQIVEKEITKNIEILFDYSQMNEIMLLVKRLDLNVVQRKLEKNCTLTVCARLNEVDRITLEIDKIYGPEWKMKEIH